MLLKRRPKIPINFASMTTESIMTTESMANSTTINVPITSATSLFRLTVSLSNTDSKVDFFDIERKLYISENEKAVLQEDRQRVSEVLAIHANLQSDSANSKKDIIQQVAEEFNAAPEDIKGRHV